MEKKNNTKNEKQSNENESEKVVFAYKCVDKTIITDPNGSYTGVCEKPHDEPVQDADDL